MKNLIVYYSYTGNTKQIAEMLEKKLNADILEIKMKKNYAEPYNKVIEIGKKEVEEKFKPEILPININLKDYDNIILGSPVWWYSFAPAMRTFLSEYDLSGKTIYPFATNGGWIGHIFEDIKQLCPNATVKEGLDLYFTGGKLKTPVEQIEKWISNIK